MLAEPGGGDAFWAAPLEDGSEAYILEEWGIDGTLRRTLRRQVSWLEWLGAGVEAVLLASAAVTARCEGRAGSP